MSGRRHCSLGSWLGFADRAGTRKIDQLFSGRELLSDEQFFERYFSNGGVSKEVAIGVRRAFIEGLMFDMRRLSPDDSFGDELQFVWKYDSLADVEMISRVEKQFGVTITEAEGRETVTMGALIRLVDLKVKDK